MKKWFVKFPEYTITPIEISYEHKGKVVISYCTKKTEGDLAFPKRSHLGYYCDNEQEAKKIVREYYTIQMEILNKEKIEIELKYNEFKNKLLTLE